MTFDNGDVVQVVVDFGFSLRRLAAVVIEQSAQNGTKLRHFVPS